MAGSPLVLGHRGASRDAPENTLAAFRLARTQGADGVELDVRRTADGVLVIHHDPVLDGFGLLAEHPYVALRAARPEVPTLEAALDELAGLVVNVEIKCLPWEPDPDPAHEVAAAVVALVAERDLYGEVVVSSFDLATIDALRAIDAAVTTGWLTMGRSPVETAPIASAHGHAWLHPDRGVLAADAGPAIAAAHDAGVRVDVWTVDDPDEIRRLAGAGVDAVITNVPAVALAALAR